jgi:hypothetical protein
MSRALDDLSPTFRPYADRFLAKLVEARIMVMIVTTRRTQAEQDDAVRRKVSWTRNSRHLTGDAMDIAPYHIYDLHGDDKAMWDEEDPVWLSIGKIGVACGLKWGVVDMLGQRKDLGHFELPRPVSDLRRT